MMSRKLVATALVCLLATTTLVIVGPAATAQETVPTKPSVPMEKLPNLAQKFYLRFPDVGQTGQPNCQDPQSDSAPFLALSPADAPLGDVGGRASCSYPAAIEGSPTDASTKNFVAQRSLWPRRPVNFTGNVTTFVYNHMGNVPSGVTLDVNVFSADSTHLAGGQIVGGDGDGDGGTGPTISLTLRGTGATTGRVQMAQDQNFVVSITGVATSSSPVPNLPTGVPAGAPTWTINDVNSFLEIRSEDALRAAIWVTNEKDELRDVFAPITNESQLPADNDRRLVGHFALASAFGFDDASRGDPAEFTLLFENRPVEVLVGGGTVIEGVLNLSQSVTDLGVAVWSFPTDLVNYRGYRAGEYVLHVDKAHHSGSPVTRAVDKKFAITSQSVDLRPFADARVPGLVETQSHSVQGGSSTTYLLMVNNTGSVNDTFFVNVSTPNAPAGWSHAVGGPDVISGRVFVPAKETRVFTLTVNAPLGATGQIIHIVNLSSNVDRGARSRDLTLVSAVGNEIQREVGIVFLAPSTVVEPGVETIYPVYVWNRGTRTANISLQIEDKIVQGWSADLAFGNSNVRRIVVSGIQPGDIGQATLKISGPVSAAVDRQDVEFNATHQDAAGVSARRIITFSLRSVTGVAMQVLSNVGSTSHIAEVTGDIFVSPPDGTGQQPSLDPRCGQPPPLGKDCTDDGVDGLWFRLWVTNTGRVADTFRLTGSNYDEARVQGGCTSTAFRADAGLDNPLGADLNFFFRFPGGGVAQRDVIENLQPGNTSEIYVWMGVDRFQDLCLDDQSNEDFFSFVAQARGDRGSIARAVIRGVAKDNDGHPGVFLEGVVRKDGYSTTSSIVDITNATKRTIVGGIRPGDNATFYVRMTNLASWAYADDIVPHAPDLNVKLVGVDHEGGWNVSIRPVFTTNNDILNNPYRAQYNLTNNNTAIDPPRREAWIDRELEVVVQAPTPENGSVLAGISHEFNIVATNANGTGGDQSTLEIKTIVGELADVKLRTDATRTFAHPGEPGAFLLYISNNGSSPATVTLRAAPTPETPAGWQASPNAQTFPLAAFKNRTLALLVTPPVGASQGSTGVVSVTVEYAKNPFFPTDTTNVTQLLTTEVVAPGTLQLTTGTSTATIGPAGTANFTMTLRNSGSLQLPFRMSATPIPNWTVTVSPEQGTLNPGEIRTAVLVLTAPADVVNNTEYASIVRVEEPGGATNFDTQAFTVNILGGKALPKLNVPNLAKRVERNGVQHFEVQVQNVGTAAGRLPLEVRSGDPAWIVGLQDRAGGAISAVTLGANELQTINVTVRAPFLVPERTVVPVEIIAYSPDQSLAAKQTLAAEVHDYGVAIALQPSSIDALPGAPAEIIVRVRNTGNDNDTLNFSANLVDLPEWSVQFSDSDQETRLEPNQEVEIRATFRSDSTSLPTPRAYTFPFWVGTRGGQDVNITKNMTVAAVVTIPNYRAYDVDKDGELEVTADLDKRAGNGFEEFREIRSAGLATQVVAKPIFDGRTTFFLDVPTERHDGVADVWFNPETVHAFEIEHFPDINGDGTPDYLLDTDRDGKIDKAFDTATERFWDVVEVKIFADDRIQYLIDINGDGRPDRFYDPETKKVTRTQNAESVGKDLVGIDVDDDSNVDYYYNTRTKETSGAEISNFGDFARDYWYFFVVFAALVLLTVLVLVRRSRKEP